VLLSDDALYRKLAADVFKIEGLWLQAVLLQMVRARDLILEQYNSSVIGLAAHCHGHVWTSADNLRLAYESDTDGSLRDFTTLATCLGGPNAELRSHCNVVLGVLGPLWNNPSTMKQGRATGMFLEAVTRGRFNDYASMIGFIAAVREKTIKVDCLYRCLVKRALLRHGSDQTRISTLVRNN
jgi:hypothetical protein